MYTLHTDLCSSVKLNVHKYDLYEFKVVTRGLVLVVSPKELGLCKQKLTLGMIKSFKNCCVSHCTNFGLDSLCLTQS